MILLLDRGNTRVKWRLIEGEQFVAEGVDDDDLPLLAGRDLLGWGVTQVLIASVAGEAVTAKICQTVQRLFGGVGILEVRTLSEFKGFRPAYKNAGTIGVDRWLQLLAVHRAAVYPALVISMGTAITVDKLDGDGAHVGGLIAPGWGLLNSVVQNSTALIDVKIPKRPDVLGMGVDTASCLYAGVSQMLFAYIECVDRQYGADCLCKLICGGDAKYMTSVLQGYQKREAFVLDGLSVIAANLDEYMMCLGKQNKEGAKCD